MVNQINLDTICRGYGAGLRPLSVDLVDVLPLEEIGGDRLADEGKVLHDPRVK